MPIFYSETGPFGLFHRHRVSFRGHIRKRASCRVPVISISSFWYRNVSTSVSYFDDLSFVYIHGYSEPFYGPHVIVRSVLARKTLDFNDSFSILIRAKPAR
ncbi:hypothetical protein HanRHA438_Chr13g0616371 [Helianthus annuus]|uniref:Uncharacterized protein n=1 Tax=Helianthus annuus TaxID=4232 RepID=A0A9K3HDX0_HELAN|nr:hypothetical protein HanXRQr2_Chr13g0605901 [Helianthus annuus]KAJ0850717.1 hypothetical protein HanPSC8_Chr13g0584081 [Helianthus annuus]KAJ0859768.1 hypothetical protein HanRHA438_Chr13g0616371 [Helianthus annuus]